MYQVNKISWSSTGLMVSLLSFGLGMTYGSMVPPNQSIDQSIGTECDDPDEDFRRILFCPTRDRQQPDSGAGVCPIQIGVSQEKMLHLAS